VTPSPRVTLVLEAWLLITRRGRLTADSRRRASVAAADAGAWAGAERLASDSGLRPAVGLLRRALESGASWTPGRRRAEVARASVGAARSLLPAGARSVLRERRRPVLIALSGPDGSGKSTQVDELRRALGHVGIPTGGAWAPTTTRRPLPAGIRRLIRSGRGGAPGEGRRPGLEGPASVGGRPRTTGVAVKALEHGWVTTIAVRNAAEMWSHVWRQRAEEVLVLDRFTLDASVKLEYWYHHRRGLDIGFERRLFQLLTPKADVSVLLVVPPEVNHARRPEDWSLPELRIFWSLYLRAAEQSRAAVVDAHRPVSEVAADVVTEVWRRLP
jgi:thymidylate kinase